MATKERTITAGIIEHSGLPPGIATSRSSGGGATRAVFGNAGTVAVAGAWLDAGETLGKSAASTPVVIIGGADIEHGNVTGGPAGGIGRHQYKRSEKIVIEGH